MQIIQAVILWQIFCLAPLSQDTEKKVDELVKAYTRQKRFSGAVLVAKGDKILLKKGYGLANVELDVPNQPETRFHIASLTKQFTAVAIMQLEERGLLSLNDPVSKYLPDFPKAVADKVTIHHLLSHTGGLNSFFDDEPNPSRFRQRMSLEQVIALFKDKPLEFEPGAKFKYSDSGYVLLTAILEKVSKTTWDRYLEENIFRPLGMKNTGYSSGEKILKNRAAGYDAGGKELQNAEPVDISCALGAGALYSTVGDLYLWDRSLYTDTLVKKNTLQKIFSPVKSNYGYGWVIDEAGGRKRTWHNGGYPGYSSNITRLIVDDVCIVVLANRFPSSADAIARDLAAILLGQPYQLPEPPKEIISVPKQILDTYVGEYRLTSGTAFSITRENEKPFIQLAGQPKLELYPESETQFILKVVDVRIEFTKDAGKVTGLILYQGNSKVTGSKLK